MLFAAVRAYATDPFVFWTASRQPGDLDSQAEHDTENFKGLQVKRLWFNPVLDSSAPAFFSGSAQIGMDK
jgi:hypothetical protein